jgi:branched-chain amino acid transport system permease protein
VLQLLAEGMRGLLTVFGIDVPGVKQLVFGVVLLFVVLALPDGIWPWLAKKLGVRERDS